MCAGHEVRQGECRIEQPLFPEHVFERAGVRAQRPERGAERLTFETALVRRDSVLRQRKRPSSMGSHIPTYQCGSPKSSHKA